MTDAKIWLTNNTNPATTTKILPSNHPHAPGPGEVKNPEDTDKLTGELIIKDYVNLEEINLSKNELTKITFISCPKLKKINVSGNKATGVPVLEILDIERLSVDPATGKPTKSVLQELECGGNKIKKVDFTYCQNLIHFGCPANPELDMIVNIDKVEGIETINMKNSGPVKVMHATKESVFRSVVEEVKELFEVEHAGSLPMETVPDPKNPGKTIKRINKLALKSDLMDKVIKVQNPQLKTEKENAEKERDEAKDALTNLLTEIVNGAGLGLTGNDITKDKIIAKIKEIKQQAVQATNSLLNKVNDLGLGLAGGDITEDKVLEKIRGLINKPTTSCTHTDYDTIKAERDRLKENKGKENIDKEALVKNIEEKFSGWGIKDNAYKEKLVTASVNEVEELRNELINERFSELGKERKTALGLNITLGVLTVGSLLVLGWLLMREANPPKVEPEQDKKEKK